MFRQAANHFTDYTGPAYVAVNEAIKIYDDARRLVVNVYMKWHVLDEKLAGPGVLDVRGVGDQVFRPILLFPYAEPPDWTAIPGRKSGARILTKEMEIFLVTYFDAKAEILNTFPDSLFDEDVPGRPSHGITIMKIVVN